jgi:hypothetical protein
MDPIGKRSQGVCDLLLGKEKHARWRCCPNEEIGSLELDETAGEALV